MHLRTATALAVILALLAVGAATAARSDRAVVASAKGRMHWTIPLPNAFGVVVKIRDLSFRARKRANGTAAGRFHYHQVVEGESFIFDVRVTCLGLYDGGKRAKIGGLVTGSNDPTLPDGRYAWFQVFDNGRRGTNDERTHKPRDQSSLVGFGTEEANEAFCNSPALPRFGPWDVKGWVGVSVHDSDEDDDEEEEGDD